LCVNFFAVRYFSDEKTNLLSVDLISATFGARIRCWLGQRSGFLNIYFLVQNRLREIDECLLDINVGFRRSLQKADTIFSRNRLSSFFCNDSLVFHVTLVSQDHFLYVLIGMLLDVPKPLGNVVKRFRVCYIVNQHDPHCTSVVRCSDGVKSFLSGSVPYLKFDFLSTQFYCLDLEVNSNGGYERCVECVITESEQDAGFAHTRVPNQEEFKQEVVAFLGHLKGD